jgi:nucleoside-diphosphate-sugar epimerase
LNSIFFGNLTNEKFLNGLPNADFIVHAAGYGQPDKFMNQAIETISLNTQSLLALLGKLNKNGRLLYCSSSEIYSGSKSKFFSEDEVGSTTPQHPRSAYIEGKKIGETICKSFNQTNQILNKRAISVRLASVYGPGYRDNDSRVLNNFIDSAIFSKKVNILDTGSSVRTYCYLTDAIEMCLKVLLNGVENVYNIGTPEKISIIKLAKLVGKLTHSPVNLPNKPNDFKIGAPKRVNLNLDRTLRLCNKNSFIDLKEGISRTIEWRKKQFQNT